ncbi:hypothetical protein UXP11_02665 [Enterobacter hormaechei]|uniref:hypothetical protein n=1 Tax=Enterobacter hormaechei TaxID=158836 RepID=UPI0028740131|nr:hypothetical protein [Enterobacter hormaechei]MDR9941477.1 hypothetical protein [Enterobacter hormaechei subsp. xiangfangensis]HAS1290057.1 hypothetical protein [Enterobacter hormaechei]HAS1541615.1 hypothetical protein [Enterobacter hormaechei]HCD2856448.1 hypothetical protein [Enterobacter hormaechei]
MTNVSAVEKMAELMQQIEVNSPRVAALHYCLSESARHIAELEQKLAESQREFRAADATIENLQMQVEKLAAENAGLKKFCKDAAFDADYEAQLGMERGGFTDALNNIKTPATDAFLAEVRASAVDEVCMKISNAIINCYQDEMVGLDEAATICGDFAAQIRKERSHEA